MLVSMFVGTKTTLPTLGKFAKLSNYFIQLSVKKEFLKSIYNLLSVKLINFFV